jgi:hypothetical protein
MQHWEASRVMLDSCVLGSKCLGAERLGTETTTAYRASGVKSG